MATVDLDKTSFDAVTGQGIVLIDWWASWCGPCRAFAPIYAAASERHPDVVFAKIDTDAETELAGGFGIRAIPTLMAFRDGVLLLSQPGAVPAAALDDLIAKLKALDMAEIKQRIAETAENS